MPKEVKKILIIRPDVIGDVLLITPAISLLRKKFPEAYISILVKAYAKDAIANNPDINEIILDPLSEKQKSVFAFAKEIKAKQFDLSVHFYNEFPYALLAFLARIPCRLGDRSKLLFGYLYNLKANQEWGNPTLHEVEHNLLLLKPLDIDISSPPPLKITVPNNFGEKFLTENKINPNDLVIGINLGTGKSNRPWLAESFVQTIDLLNDKLGAKIILVGGPKDKEKEAFILSNAKHKPLSQVGIPPHLPELISIMSQCKFFITVDTGLMHIAAALKIPTVALFPVKTMLPSQWGPWQTPHVIIRNPSACKRKCVPSNCIYDDCLKGIRPEAVLNAINLLQKANKTY